uniref:Actin maturation protease n=1 Tax=Leptobrachium leishanense TaxID=445787 RepID=A0A8C5R9K7_9ANUR
MPAEHEEERAPSLDLPVPPHDPSPDLPVPPHDHCLDLPVPPHDPSPDLPVPPHDHCLDLPVPPHDQSPDLPVPPHDPRQIPPPPEPPPLSRLAPPPPLPHPAQMPPIPPSVVKSKFFKMVAENSDPKTGGCDELKRTIRKRQDRFRADLKWLLYNQHVPSLIQEGPQCGLVALWMAGMLIHEQRDVSVDRIVKIAVSRGYTAQGEMFSAGNMCRLAEEVFGCRCELLIGGMEGNRSRILHQLTAGLPVLIPYDEDFNHEPCERGGHRAHWAVVSGALLGMKSGSFQPDPDVPGLHYPPSDPGALIYEDIEETYLVIKQGKSQRYQLWDYMSGSRSNRQLLSLDPKRASDGTLYVLPEGGVAAGLCGQVVLLQPNL